MPFYIKCTNCATIFYDMSHILHIHEIISPSGQCSNVSLNCSEEFL